MKMHKFLVVFVLLLSQVVCFADNGFGDDVQDVPAPINQWVFIAMFFAALYGCNSIKNAVKKINRQQA